MTDDIISIHKPLCASIVLNIFLAAFIVGRLSAPAPFPEKMKPHGAVEKPLPPAARPMAPPPPQEACPVPRRLDQLTNPALVSPFNLLSPLELTEPTNINKQTTIKIFDLRNELGAKLKQGNLKTKDIIDRFNAVNKLSDDARSKVQAAVAEKIVTLPEQDRLNLANDLIYNMRGKPANTPPNANKPANPPAPPAKAGPPKNDKPEKSPEKSPEKPKGQ